MLDGIIDGGFINGGPLLAAPGGGLEGGCTLLDGIIDGGFINGPGGPGGPGGPFKACACVCVLVLMLIGIDVDWY